MSPSKKSTAPKKATKTSAKSVKKSTGNVNEHDGDVVAQNGVQPTTNTTNASSEQHNSPAISEEAIRQRAYELYEQRGGDDGRHHEDWFRAEQEILERRRNH
jgi:hypothetical protein